MCWMAYAFIWRLFKNTTVHVHTQHPVYKILRIEWWRPASTNLSEAVTPNESRALLKDQLRAGRVGSK